MWMDYGNAGWGYGWGILGVAHMLLWWVLPIFGIVVLARWLFGRGADQGAYPHQRAPEVLAERFARGEIDKDEFEAKRRDLNS
jgi:putative membrane protein